jgi:hypothetical protein
MTLFNDRNEHVELAELPAAADRRLALLASAAERGVIRTEQDA